MHITEAEKFWVVLTFCTAGWLLSFLRPALPQIRRIPKRPLRRGHDR